MAEIDASVLLEGDTPRLIDEWQLDPKLWDAIRFEVDHRHDVGQFVLTGSAVPADEKDMHHSGTGRFSWLTMRPMSLYESGESNGKVSLAHLFETTEKIVAINKLKIDDLKISDLPWWLAFCLWITRRSKLWNKHSTMWMLLLRKMFRGWME